MTMGQKGGLPFLFFILILKRFYLFIFRELEREGKRGEKHQCVFASCVPRPLGTWPATQACALTGNQTRDPLVRRTALNPLSHTNQGSSCFSKNNILCFFRSSCSGFVSSSLLSSGQFTSGPFTVWWTKLDTILCMI